jgi:hypothetical protein
MARTFLTNLNLEQNQLIKAVIQNATQDPNTGVAGQVYYNTASDTLKVYSGSASAWVAVGSVEFIGDSVADLIEQGTGISINYDDANNSLTITNTGVTSIAGTAGRTTLSASAGSVVVDLATVSPTGSGTGGFDSGTSKITIPVVNADSYGRVTSITSASTTVVTSLAGTANEIEVSAANGAVTIGLPDDVTVGGNLTISGNLTVNGDTTTLNTQTLNVEDNLVVLNSNVTSSPTLDAGIEVERGTSTNAKLYWDETQDQWSLTQGGSAVYRVSTEGHTHVSTDVTDFTEAVQDVVGGLVAGSNSLSANYNDGSNSLTLDTTLSASGSFLSKTSGLAVDKSALESAFVSDGFTRKFSQIIGNSASTSYTVTHNLGTRNVQVQVYGTELSAYAYQTVETDVDRTDANTVVIGFATPPGVNTFSVVVIG